LREAVAHGPILFPGLENVHEHVLRADAGAVAEQLRGRRNSAFFCSMVRVLNTVIWINKRSSLRSTPR
jgi:hypothetical protein